MPGGAVALVEGDDRGEFHAFGDAAPGLTADADTRFAYRSITKSFVGTVVLQLADEGAISLDDTVSDHLDDVPGGDAITLRELGTMRSGLPNYSAAPGFAAAFGPDPEREPATSELLAIAFAEPSSFEPGRAYQYSNTNTLLLGEIIEKATGSSWQDEVRRRIGEPLGLTSLEYGFATPTADASGFQIGGAPAPEELPDVAPGWFGAAGGMTGTVRDLARWGEALGSGELLSEEAQRERLKTLGSTSDDADSPVYDRYGFALGEIDGWVGHTGAGLGFQSLVMYDAQTGRTVAILLNGTGENQDLPAEIFARLLEDAR
nr:serine hydrolase domain-containing protein [Leucobacter weissii]